MTALKLKVTTKYNYYSDWQHGKGISAPSSGSVSEAKPISEAKGKGKIISELEIVVEPSKEVREMRK